MTEENGWDPEYDAFIEAAEKDDRLGEQHAVVKAAPETLYWDDGREHYDVPLMLTTAHNFDLNLQLNAKPTKDELAEAKASGNQKRIRGIGFGLRLWKELQEHYGIVSIGQIREGLELDVFTEKRKNKKNGKSYVQIVKVLPPKKAGAAADDKPPF